MSRASTEAAKSRNEAIKPFTTKLPRSPTIWASTSCRANSRTNGKWRVHIAAAINKASTRYPLDRLFNCGIRMLATASTEIAIKTVMRAMKVVT